MDTLFIIILIVLLGFYFIFKSFRIKSSKQDYYFRLGELLLIGAVLGFLSNELIAPLISPRVSDIKITPIYIQSQEPDNPNAGIKYYTLFDVEYEIELPYFLFTTNFNLKMPGKVKGQSIDLITSFQENNPYYEINLPQKSLSGSFLSYQQLKGVIPIIIKANAREIKKIHAHFIVREESDLHEGTASRSDYFWWTYTTISPIKSTGNIVTSPKMSFVGLGIDKYGNYYRFYDVLIKSLTDLEIKGLRIPFPHEFEFCNDGIKLDKEFDIIISIDLEPKESKHILALSRIPADEKLGKTDFVFNFTSEDECYGQWLKYKELTSR